MADGTHIEWTDATWNIINGCSVVTPGCTNCYAMKLAGTRLKHIESREGLTIDTKAGPVWNGTTKFHEPALLDPIKWKRPRKIFVCAHGDLFHDSVPDEWIDRVFAVMALARQHQFQVLTKRSARMREYMSKALGRIADAVVKLRREPICIAKGMGPSAVGPLPHVTPGLPWWPLPNVWLGVSVEDQTRADERIPDLLATPAAVRWISAEPLLGPIDLAQMQEGCPVNGWLTWLDALDWVVVGGESGPRPMHPAWARQLRDQCAATGVPFLFKQFGSWGPVSDETQAGDVLLMTPHPDYPGDDFFRLGQMMRKVGKKAAGRVLDGVTHDGYPA